MIEEILFFCFGMPKSGTTWLQMLLNAHPEISCRPEDNLSGLMKAVPEMLQSYNKTIEEVDKRTAQQGVIGYDERDAFSTFELLVRMLFMKMHTPVKGLNDNSICHNLGVYKSMFPEAAFIYIVRDPRDVALSGWYHNLRIEDHTMQEDTLQTWATKTARWWVDINTKVQQQPEILTVKYETLKDDIVNVITVLDQDHKYVPDMLRMTNFNKMQQTGNGFFRAAQSGRWGDYSRHTLEQIDEIAGRWLDHYGYQRT